MCVLEGRSKKERKEGANSGSCMSLKLEPVSSKLKPNSQSQNLKCPLSHSGLCL